MHGSSTAHVITEMQIKTSKYHRAPIRTVKIPNAADAERWKVSSTAGRSANCAATEEDSLAVSRKSNTVAISSVGPASWSFPK